MSTEAVKWGEGRLDRFRQWMEWEIPYALTTRAALEKQWRNWLVQYRPSPRQPTRSFPFEGASNSVLPLTAIDVDQLYASFMQTIHATDDLWVVQAFNERWQPAAKPLQDTLTFLDKSTLKMYHVNQRVVLEMVKLGTGIYKHGWHYEERPVHRYDDKGKWHKVKKRVGRPFVDHVQLPNLLLPPSATAIQPDVQGGAPWVAERIRMPTQRFLSMANASGPLYPTIDKTVLQMIVNFEERTQTDHRQAIQDLDYLRRAFPQINFEKDTAVGQSAPVGNAGSTMVREIELWEIHARFPVDGDSEDDIIVWWHPPTRTVLRPIFQPYHHGQRPYEPIRYFPGDGFYGIGVCEQAEIFQQTISELYNFLSDNVLLSNSIGIAAQSGSNIAPGEPVYPGKVWVVDGPINESFKSFQMGQVYPSLPELIGFVQGVKERRTSLSDLQIGSLQSLPSRTPATTIQALLQEGKRRPDLTIKDMRYSGLGVLGLRMIQYLQQYAGAMAYDAGGTQWLKIAIDVLGMPEGMAVAEKLATPMENAELGLGVSINAISGTANKDIEKESLRNLLNQHAQLAPGFLQLLQVAAQMPGTPVANVAIELAKGQSNLYHRILEQYDIRDPESIAPEIPEAPPVPQGPPGFGPQPGGAGAAPAPGQPPGMAGVPQGAGNGVPLGV